MFNELGLEHRFKFGALAFLSCCGVGTFFGWAKTESTKMSPLGETATCSTSIGGIVGANSRPGTFDAAGGECLEAPGNFCDAIYRASDPPRWPARPLGTTGDSQQALPAGLLLAQARTTGNCSRVEFEGTSVWWTSVSWLQQQQAIAVVDGAIGSIRVLASDGSERLTAGPAQFGDRKAVLLQPLAVGFLARFGGSRLSFLEPSFSLNGDLDLKAGGVGSVFEFAATEKTIVFYGQAEYRGEAGLRKVMGFHAADLPAARAGGAVRNLRLLKEETNQVFFTLSLRHIATDGETFYFLTRGDTPSLYRFDEKEPTKLVEVPVGLRGQLTGQNSGPPSSVRLFGELEGLSVAAGVVVDEGRPFLLIRQPEGRSTRWQVLSAETRGLGPGRALTLPSTAPHVQVVVDGDKWLLIETDHVTEWGKQALLGLVQLPAKWLRSGGSPLASPDRGPVCSLLEAVPTPNRPIPTRSAQALLANRVRQGPGEELPNDALR